MNIVFCSIALASLVSLSACGQRADTDPNGTESLPTTVEPVDVPDGSHFSLDGRYEGTLTGVTYVDPYGQELPITVIYILVDTIEGGVSARPLETTLVGGTYYGVEPEEILYGEYGVLVGPYGNYCSVFINMDEYWFLASQLMQFAPMQPGSLPSC